MVAYGRHPRHHFYGHRRVSKYCQRWPYHSLISTLACMYHPDDRFAEANEWSQIYGLLLLPVAIAFCIYALYMYTSRATMIRRKDPGPCKFVCLCDFDATLTQLMVLRCPDVSVTCAKSSVLVFAVLSVNRRRQSRPRGAGYPVGHRHPGQLRRQAVLLHAVIDSPLTVYRPAVAKCFGGKEMRFACCQPLHVCS